MPTVLPRAPRLLATALCLAALAAPAGAGAADPRIPLTGRMLDVTPFDLGYDAAGRMVLGWRALGGTPDATHAFLALGGTTAGGAARTARRLPAGMLAARAVLTGPRALALVTWREEPAGKVRTRSVIAISRADTATLLLHGTRRLAVGPVRHVSYDGPQPTLTAPQVAALPGGGAAVAWVRGDARAAAGVWVVLVRPDGTRGRAQRVGPSGTRPVLAAGADGSVLLAWQHGRRILARVRRGGRWGTAVTAATVSRRQWAAVESLTATATTPGGRFALGLLQTERTGAGVWARSSVHVWTAATGWHGTALGELDFAPTGQTAYVTDRLRVIVLPLPGGGLRAVWPVLAGGHVAVVSAPLDGPLAGLRSTLSPPGVDVAIEDAAAGPGGLSAVAWFDLSNGTGTSNVAEVGPAGAVHRVTGLAGERAVLGARVAYEPRSGRPTVVWAEGVAGRGYRLVGWTAPAPGR